MAHAGRDDQLAVCSRTSESQLRRAYFAQAADVAVRYGMSFDRVLAHLGEARTRHPHIMVSAIRHVDDLVHAIACVDGSDVAWRDLVDRHERALIRVCRQWLDPTDAIIFVRRLVSELRRDEGTGVQSLRSFAGATRLRRWLADRVMGRMSRAGFSFTADEPFESARRPVAAHVVEGNVVWQAPF